MGAASVTYARFAYSFVLWYSFPPLTCHWGRFACFWCSFLLFLCSLVFFPSIHVSLRAFRLQQCGLTDLECGKSHTHTHTHTQTHTVHTKQTHEKLYKQNERWWNERVWNERRRNKRRWNEHRRNERRWIVVYWYKLTITITIIHVRVYLVQTAMCTENERWLPAKSVRASGLCNGLGSWQVRIFARLNSCLVTRPRHHRHLKHKIKLHIATYNIGSYHHTYTYDSFILPPPTVSYYIPRTII